MGASPNQSFAQSIVIFFGCASTLSIFLRIWSRKITKNFGCDDILMIPGWMCAVAMTGTTLVYIDEKQIGVDSRNRSPDKSQIKGDMYLWIDSMLYIPAMLFIRSSILLFLARLDQTAKVRFWLWAAAVWCSLSCLMWFVYFPLKCIPIQKVWDPSVPGDCSNIALGNTVGCGLWILGDLLIAIIPTVLCYNLHMPLGKKIGVIVLLSLGWFVVAASLLRLIYMIRLYYTDDDLTFDLTFVTCHLEANLSVITGSGPHLNPLFRRLYRTIRAGTPPKEVSKVPYQQQSPLPPPGYQPFSRNSWVRRWTLGLPAITLNTIHSSESTEGLREESQENGWNIKKTTKIEVNGQS